MKKAKEKTRKPIEIRAKNIAIRLLKEFPNPEKLRWCMFIIQQIVKSKNPSKHRLITKPQRYHFITFVRAFSAHEILVHVNR